MNRPTPPLPRLAALVGLLLAFAADGAAVATAPGTAAPAAALPAAAPRFNAVHLKATHNSYAARSPVGGLARQLDAGVRVVELDFYATRSADEHDYVIGHARPGDDVRHDQGNPASDRLGDWLALVAGWCDKHPAAGPVVVYLDCKGPLADLPDDRGGIGALNAAVKRAFGKRLLRAADVPAADAWPAADDLRGRVMVVLSGDFPTRAAYRLAPKPARPEQVLFVESQQKDGRASAADPAGTRRRDADALRDDSGVHFFAAGGSQLDWAAGWRRKGKVVRLWQVPIDDKLRAASPPPANFPATDDPYAPAYADYCRAIGTRE